MATTTLQSYVPISDRIAALFSPLSEGAKRYKLYRRTLSELDSLSDRELLDFGMYRGIIRQVAFEAAYGSK